MELPFYVVIATGRVGEIREEKRVAHGDEGGRWRVNWQPSLIFKDLGTDDRILSSPATRSGAPSSIGRAGPWRPGPGSVGVEPGLITDEAGLLATLQQELKIDPAGTAMAAPSRTGSSP